ncbi:hypothetical protein JCM33374_g3779 [Metschnikowia sp. JCM 33374]|nr:hypothetical protein JCM33374_g3779 [Metschnikowia sp. JCM 33374]
MPVNTHEGGSNSNTAGGRRRSNSQSQVQTAPSFLSPETSLGGASRSGAHGAKTQAQGENQSSAKTTTPTKTPTKSGRMPKRAQAEFYVTLTSLNDTFATKHIHVPYFPETCKLGRPTGTKVKPHVTNGYFDSRVLSRNHACMFVDPKSGRVMVQDMGSSNGTFVNQEKLSAEPVAINVGDTLNLGFNIQVETNHKQISAKIDTINVVSNNPKGAVMEMLPRLTKTSLGNFSDPDMRHYEFIQTLCARLTASDKSPSASPSQYRPPTQDKALVGDEVVDTKQQALKAFDYGMFSDIVPSLDEMFESSASHSYDDAGIYTNSGLQASPELLSTLDYLGANLARVKQQNSTLSSLESFFSHYAACVDDINTSYVQDQIQKSQIEYEKNSSQEKEKTSLIINEQSSKLAAQARLVSTLEAEIANLKIEHRNISETATKMAISSKSNSDDDNFQVIQEVKETNTDADNELNINNDALHTQPSLNSKDTDMPSRTLETAPQRDPSSLSPSIPGSIIENMEQIPSSSSTSGDDALSSQNFLKFDDPNQNEISEKEMHASGKQAFPELQNSKLIGPCIEQLNRSLIQYKNQGVVVGFLVVIAGFIYQNSK